MDYYQIAHQASRQIKGHPGLEYLQILAIESDKVLDVGCGEGTRLNTLLPTGISGWGIDINRKAINTAKSQYPNHKFQSGSGLAIPFPDNNFDLVYSAFALEHTTNPEKFIQEMIRVTKKNGHTVILCPNYGAPNRRSPVSVQNPVNKLITGFKNDFLPQPGLNWQLVTPKKTYTEIDADTTVEPYLGSLVRFIKFQGLKITKAESVWEKENLSLNPRKLIIWALGKLKIFPFGYWGPQIFLAAKK